MKSLKKINTLVFALFISLNCAPVLAQGSASGELTGKCTYPKQPSIPNGRNAEMDEMLEAQKAIKAYQASAQEFRTCIDGVIATWNAQGMEEAELDEKREIAVSFYNRSVADEEEVADMFNTAIRAFKSK